jgi:hypothetical protein
MSSVPNKKTKISYKISIHCYREELARSWRRLHNEQLHNLYASPNVIRVVNSRRMRWVGKVARMGGMRNSYKFWSENLKRRDHSEDLGVDGKIIRVILE